VTNIIRRFPTLSFFVLAYVFTWAIAVPLLLSKRGWTNLNIPHELEGLAAFGPFAAALLVTLLVSGRNGIKTLLASCIKWRVPLLWLLFVLLSPLVVLAIAIALAPVDNTTSGSTGLYGFLFSAAFIELIVFGGLFQGLGEEPGWRGLAIPQLRRRHGPLLATLMLFPVWLCWHLPMFLSREFTLGAWFGFSLGILSAAIWLTFIYDATRSVLMAIVWHMLINIARGIAMIVSMQAFLAFGQVVAISAVLIAAYWIVRKPALYSGFDGASS
jgi:membrane protease YdiL (CAAX protease family)